MINFQDRQWKNTPKEKSKQDPRVTYTWPIHAKERHGQLNTNHLISASVPSPRRSQRRTQMSILTSQVMSLYCHKLWRIWIFIKIRWILLLSLPTLCGPMGMPRHHSLGLAVDVALEGRQLKATEYVWVYRGSFWQCIRHDMCQL